MCWPCQARELTQTVWEVQPTAHLCGGCGRGVTVGANSTLVTNARLSLPRSPAWHAPGLTYCRKSFFIMLWSVRCSAGS